MCLQGRVAAKNMVGKSTEYNTIPFFWTAVFGKSLRYVGHAPDGFDEVMVEGDTTSKNPKFIAFYVKDDKIVSVLTLQRDPVAIACSELMKHGVMPTPYQIASGQRNSADILKQHKHYSNPRNKPDQNRPGH